MTKITPTQFLDAIFFDVPDDETILVAKPIHKGKYKGRFKQLRPSHDSFNKFSTGSSDPVDWYFGISTVKNTSTTTLKRRKQDMCAVYCVVLDDIGTKCEVPPVSPSWILETSEGNFQYGYMLTTPVDNMQWFELFMAGVGAKGYADKGTLDSTRIMRVPLSKNVKEGRGGWLSALTLWNPDITYDLPELAEKFDLDLPPESKVSRVSYIASAYNDMDMPEIADPVFEWLQEGGFVRGKQGNGFYEIQCPWHKEHSDGRDEAGYKPLGIGDEPEYRLFKCHHSHEGGTNDFLDWVHDKSGIEVGSRDAVSLEVALADMATTLGVDVSEIKQGGDHDPTPDNENRIYDFGEVLPHDLFPNKKLVGSGKNSQLCPTLTTDNLVAILDAHGVRRVRDVINRKEYCVIRGERVNIEYVYGQVRSQAVLTEFTGTAGFKDVFDAAVTLRTVDYNPVADWLDTLTWDGRSRLPDFLNLFDCNNSGVRDIVVPSWLAQCVDMARGENQGGGAVLVLTGRGGIGKTAILQSLVPRHLRDYLKTGVLMSPGNKDDVAKACGAWITELGELDGTFRRSDMAALKAFLTEEVDSYRPPYGREVLDFPRMTSFSATVNDSLFLSDMTGGGYRRFWVVECNEIEWSHKIDVGQLWAEIDCKVQSGELSRRLTVDQAELVEESAVDAALYNDDVIVQDFKRLWPDLKLRAYHNNTMGHRLTEREIISMLPSPEIAGASEKEIRLYLSRLRAYLKDSTPKGGKLKLKGRKTRALSLSGGKHMWLLPTPLAQVVNHG